MEIVIGWFIFSFIAGIIAGSRGRSGIGYFLLSIILSPLIGIVLALALPAINPNAPNPKTHVRCPDCRELVLNDARKCKHCGCALVPQK